MSSLAKIEKMTISERLREMDRLWDSLVSHAETVPSPDWHGEILAQRLERLRKGEVRFHSLDEVKRRLRNGCELERRDDH